MNGFSKRPYMTQDEVAQNIEQIRREGVPGETVLDVRVSPGIEAGPFIHIDTANDVRIIPFQWKEQAS